MNPGCLCARTGQFSVDNKNCPLALLQPLRVVHEFKHLSDAYHVERAIVRHAHPRFHIDPGRKSSEQTLLIWSS